MLGSWILIGQLLFMTASHWPDDLVLSQDSNAEGEGLKVAILILQTRPGVRQEVTKSKRACLKKLRKKP